MKTIISICLCLLSINIFSQNNWLTTGNAGLTVSNFLGTTDAKDVIFKTNNIERSRLSSSGTWRFGTSSNFASFNANGRLSFGGKGAYIVDGNKYVFQYHGNNNYGLFFDSGKMRYEFMNGNAQPVFFVNANTGDGYFKGKLGINTTKPAFDLDVAGTANFTGNLQAGSLKVGFGPEYGMIDKSGNVQAASLKVGFGPEYGMFDQNGNLRFFGSATYLVNGNQFALLCNGEPGDGLYMNGDLGQWEFRDAQSFPYFTINEKTHDIAASGGIQVGASSNAVPGNIRWDGDGFQGFDGKVWKAFVMTDVTQTLSSASSNALVARNQSLQNQIDELQNEIAELKAIIVSGQSTVNSLSINISSAALQQNVPNPFNHLTTINYTLPQTYSSAKIIVTDKNGRTLKEMNITAKGRGSLQLDASTLAAGAYQYSLYIDGKLIDTKQMVSTK